MKRLLLATALIAVLPSTHAECWTEKRCMATKTDCNLMTDKHGRQCLKPRAPEGPEGVKR
jgi:hypothetical protein